MPKKKGQLDKEVAARRAAEQVLAEEGERLRTTLASIGDAVITTDAEGRITSLNAVAEALTGRTKAEATGQPLDLVFRIVNEETRQTVQNPATRALHEGVIVGLSSRTLLIARDGKERPIDDSAAPIRGKAGEIVGCVLVFRDISQRRRLDNENASRFRDARLLAAIVESSEDAIIGKTLDGIIQSWNAAAERLFGFPAGQAVGRHISLIIPADRTAEEDQIIATLKAGRRIEHYETVRLRCDGQPVLVSLTISPIKDEAGRVIGASKIARDITRQRQAEERERLLLAEAATANAKFRAFFEQGRSSPGSWTWTAPSSNRIACLGKAAASRGSRSSASRFGKARGGRPRRLWWSGSRRRPPRQRRARRSVRRCPTSSQTAVSGSQMSPSCPSRTRRAGLCSWPRPG